MIVVLLMNGSMIKSFWITLRKKVSLMQRKRMMNNFGCNSYLEKREKAKEMADTACSIVFEKYPHWSNRRKAIMYARSHGLISEEEYEFIKEYGLPLDFRYGGWSPCAILKIREAYAPDRSKGGYVMNAPCFNCSQRKYGCHTNCPLYRVFDLEMQKRREDRLRKCLVYTDCSVERRRIISLHKHHTRK